ncbi:hypothetical protein SAMN05216223_13410 [Actinacidiphila yanglinensis]|uniref:Plasmid stabilization protein n=1 Tax=Actinacidiphila yanglinensis TaxID=310779 RepID=A0A1H6ECQ5_9ACTN|nr:hypothetical protein [Actinacidiphila yanglinensis]SEG95577.1 hypothetical protein SAMN05216223_13410 [Actinacidiphila yanglinensis]
MPAGSNRKRERQYEHIKESAQQRVYEEAKKKDVEGRSSMNKEQLRNAVGR